MSTTQKTQEQRVFWDYTPDRSRLDLPAPPTDSDIRVALAPNNKTCPLNEIITSVENEGNMRTLRRFAYTAFKRHNHSLRGCNFGIYSGAGQGKTFVVKQWAASIGIPFVFVQSPALESTWMLFELITDQFKKEGIEIVPMRSKRSDYQLPPAIVFFDEAHGLRKSLMEGALLNAMEPDDGYMAIKRPGTKNDSIVVDCKDICWVGGTTERGALFDAFESRLGTAIEWAPAGPKELPLIIKAAMDKRRKQGDMDMEIPLEACVIASKFLKVPRTAIAFATKMVQQRAMMPSDTWEQAAKIVALDLGLDEWGWTKKQVALLSALGQRPIAESRLTTVCQCRIEQIQRYELPMLQSYTNGGPFVTPVRGRGLAITAAGLLELDRRGIAHKGDKVTAEYFESKR